MLVQAPAEAGKGVGIAVQFVSCAIVSQHECMYHELYKLMLKACLQLESTWCESKAATALSTMLAEIFGMSVPMTRACIIYM